MALTPPNLDDRDFRQLLEGALHRVQQVCPQWTDLSPSDPGVMLLELFAHLTEVMIYRLNRLPEKAFIEFLRLMGVQLMPPSASKTLLRFSRSRAGSNPIQIPKGTRVTLTRTGGTGRIVSFATAQPATLDAKESEVDVPAYHCEQVEGELAGHGTGLPGQTLRTAHAPLIASTGDELDLMVGIETDTEALDKRVRAVEFAGKAFRIWREVESFTDLGVDRFAYVVDRYAGTVFFAPAARMTTPDGTLEDSSSLLAEVPPAEREIRIWYRYGGGAEGNVGAGLLTVLRDPVPGLNVTNPSPATGGRDIESVENALIRGTQEMRALSRAVTARDYEMVALGASGAVARAKAFTKAALWVHAVPGTVEVLLVPAVPDQEGGGSRVSVESLSDHQTESERKRIQGELDRKRPLGTTCLVNWVRYKIVRVKARVVAHMGETPEAVQGRALDRLYAAINPLPSGSAPGWRFGYPLRASHVYDLLLSDPGVSYADQVRLLVDEVPEKEVAAVAADEFQRGAWYAASGAVLYRSLDDGHGWEAAGKFADEELNRVKVHRSRPGLLAVTSSIQSETGASRVHISSDCGETWRQAAQTGFSIFDMDWIIREGEPLLILATDVGLYELAMKAGAVPIQIVVDPTNQDLGFYAVAASVDAQGGVSVAAAGRGATGVFLSTDGGRTGSFERIGLEGEDVRVLEVQQVGPLRYLWAGLAVPGRAAGKGCYRWELRSSQVQLEGEYFSKGWEGGSCWDLSFQGQTLFAATDQAGVFKIDPASHEPEWEAPKVGCGLPMRDVGKYEPIRSLAADPEKRFLLTGSSQGVYRSGDEGLTYDSCSRREFMETVTLPETWLFCSGEHEIEVVSEHETG